MELLTCPWFKVNFKFLVLVLHVHRVYVFSSHATTVAYFPLPTPTAVSSPLSERKGDSKRFI